MINFVYSFFVSIVNFSLTPILRPSIAYAHCDTTDGPVVNAARRALSENNINYVLIWVKPEFEKEILKALEKAKEKGQLAKSNEEKELAETEFFEFVVKIHREGEGALYEGIKPQGSVDHEIELADKAVETGKLEEVLEHITSSEQKTLVTNLFNELEEKSKYSVDDISKGREYVKVYANFIHAVEKAIKGETSEELHRH